MTSRKWPVDFNGYSLDFEKEGCLGERTEYRVSMCRNWSVDFNEMNREILILFNISLGRNDQERWESDLWVCGSLLCSFPSSGYFLSLRSKYSLLCFVLLLIGDTHILYCSVTGKVKVNSSLCSNWAQCHKGVFLTSVPHGGEWSASLPGRFIPRKEPLVAVG
jgi:hypothetical protein